MLAEKTARLVDENGLARCHITHRGEATGGQHDALGTDQILRALRGVIDTVDQWPYAIRVAKRHHTAAGDHGHYGIGTTTAPVHIGDGTKHRRRIQPMTIGGQLQLMRQHIQQHLGIGVGVDVPKIEAKHLLLERLGIGQIAVVRQHDAKR